MPPPTMTQPKQKRRSSSPPDPLSGDAGFVSPSIAGGRTSSRPPRKLIREVIRNGEESRPRTRRRLAAAAEQRAADRAATFAAGDLLDL